MSRQGVAPSAGLWSLRITAGFSGAIDVAGERWLGDRGFIGGTPVGTRHPITGTGTTVLYKHARVGMSGYNIKIAARGTYAVVLHFAEIQGLRPGRRVFDVAAQGVVRLRAVDIALAAGDYHAYLRMFAVPVTGHTLKLRFIRRLGQPLVSGIDVVRMSARLARKVEFDDEFGGPPGLGPNPRKWSFDTGAWDADAGEEEYYTRRRRNAALDGAGHLVITAMPDTVGLGEQRPYSSARIQTFGKFRFTYGLAEARMMVPAGPGLWPAFWMVGSRTYSAHAWPMSGEIDVMELLGKQPEVAYGHIVGPDRRDRPYSIGRGVDAASSLAAGYHTYSLLWLPNGVQFMLDGRPYFSTSPADLPAGDRWVANQPNVLILDLAVGGTWPGDPDATTRFPAELGVDWVRVLSR